MECAGPPALWRLPRPAESSGGLEQSKTLPRLRLMQVPMGRNRVPESKARHGFQDPKCPKPRGSVLECAGPPALWRLGRPADVAVGRLAVLRGARMWKFSGRRWLFGFCSSRAILRAIQSILIVFWAILGPCKMTLQACTSTSQACTSTSQACTSTSKACTSRSAGEPGQR